MCARTAVRLWTETDRTAVRSVTEYEIRPSEYDRQVGRPRISATVSDAELASRLAVMTDRAPGLPDLFAHRLGAVAAAHWRRCGRELPAPLLEEERFATIVELAAPLLLSRILDACEGPVMVLKGPEIAARYPFPRLRPFHDLDVLVEDSKAAHAALLAAGCRIGWDRGSAHHELPLVFPDLPIVIEVHGRVKWPAGVRAPATSDLFARTVPA